MQSLRRRARVRIVDRHRHGVRAEFVKDAAHRAVVNCKPPTLRLFNIVIITGDAAARAGEGVIGGYASLRIKIRKQRKRREKHRRLNNVRAHCLSRALRRQAVKRCFNRRDGHSHKPLFGGRIDNGQQRRAADNLQCRPRRRIEYGKAQRRVAARCQSVQLRHQSFAVSGDSRGRGRANGKRRRRFKVSAADDKILQSQCLRLRMQCQTPARQMARRHYQSPRHRKRRRLFNQHRSHKRRIVVLRNREAFRQQYARSECHAQRKQLRGFNAHIPPPRASARACQIHLRLRYRAQRFNGDAWHNQIAGGVLHFVKRARHQRQARFAVVAFDGDVREYDHSQSSAVGFKGAGGRAECVVINNVGAAHEHGSGERSVNVVGAHEGINNRIGIVGAGLVNNAPDGRGHGGVEQILRMNNGYRADGRNDINLADNANRLRLLHIAHFNNRRHRQCAWRAFGYRLRADQQSVAGENKARVAARYHAEAVGRSAAGLYDRELPARRFAGFHLRREQPDTGRKRAFVNARIENLKARKISRGKRRAHANRHRRLRALLARIHSYLVVCDLRDFRAREVGEVKMRNYKAIIPPGQWRAAGSDNVQC